MSGNNNNNMLNYFSKIPKQQLLSQQSNSQSSTTSSSSQSSSQSKQPSQTTSTTSLLTSSNDDLIDIKRSIETLEKPNNNEQINQEYIETCIKLGFKYCISQNDKHKRDLCYKLIELIANNYQLLCANNCLTAYLTQQFFDKLIKLFETSNEIYVLNLTQLFIKICGKLLHTNISITNPLLQIMEYSFKHTNNDIRAHGYECWRSLINNFALDKEFFFKQKKFNLLLMPLVNKSKTYKNENLCKSKAIAWLCLIENINEKLDAHLGNVFIPFLDFCFGYMDTTNAAQTMMNDSALVGGLDHDEKKENLKRRGSLPATFGSTTSHVKPLPSLLTIGFELFLSFICNGDGSNIPSEYQKHLKYINLSRNYRVLTTISDTRNWIKLLNYYFQIVLSHVHLLNSDLVCFMWHKLLDLFENNELDKGKKLKKLPQNSQQQQQQQQFKLNLDDDEEDEDKEELIEYFLLNSIDAVSLNHNLAVLSKPASKNNELNEMKRSLQKVLIEISTHLLKFLYDKNTYLHLLKENKVTNELEKHIKEIGDFLLHSDDANDFNYLYNLKQIIKSIDNCVHYDAIDLWSHVASKLNDRLRINKNKYLNITCIYENFDELCESFDAVYQTITYPIKQIHKIKIEQSEIKTLVNLCTTICKQFCIMYKYYTQKIEKTNTNSWFEQLMQHIHKQITHTSQVKGLKTITHVKQYFLVTQLINYLLQNLYDFRLDDEYLQQAKKKGSSEFQLTMIKAKHDDTLVNLNSLVKINNQLINNFMSIICANMIENEDGCVNKDQDQQMVSNCLLNLIDLNVKLITNCKSTHQLDTIMRLSAESLSKLFEINKLKEKSDFIKQIVQVSLTSKKLIDHYEQLFNELNVCLQHKLLSFDFDSDRLNEFEPIIYSLITFATKPAQKQKFIKTWNSTFGKCTNTILNYSKRLEKCFMDLNDATDSLNLNSGALNGGTLQNGSTGPTRKFAISLPGFNNCANIIANTSNTTANSTQMAMSIAKTNSADKENSPMMISSGVKSPIDDSSSSVPMAQLIKSKQTTQPQSTQQSLNLLLTDDESSSCGDNAAASQSQSSQNQKASPAVSNKTSNFIFSPAAGRTSLHIAAATASPTSNTSSKRKLDLNDLIDQMPDKDFVKINDKPSTTNTQSSETNFKAPSAALTEHQKEVKRERSYIPSEIHQVCIDLTSSSAIDNSMSCTFDGIEIIKVNEFKKENKEHADVEKEVETPSTSTENPITIIPDTMDVDPITATQDKSDIENNSISEEFMERNAKKIRMESANPSPKIYSKIKPNKHIELIEVTDNGEGSKLESTATTVVTVSESDNKIIIENTKSKEPEANKISLSNQEQNMEKPNEIVETNSTTISKTPDAPDTTTTTTTIVEVQEKQDDQLASQTSSQTNEEEKMDMSQDNDEEAKIDGDQENDSNIRRSARIKSKGYKSMQVVLNKVDDIIGSGVTSVNSETIAALITTNNEKPKENAEIESKTKEIEPLNESVVEIKEPEQVDTVKSSSQAKKEETNDVVVKRRGRRRTLNGDELNSITTSTTTTPATTHTVHTNEESSNTEKLLHKPRSGKIIKIRSKSVTLTANSTSPLSRRAAKTKLQKVIEKLQKTHDKDEEKTNEKDTDEDVPLVKLINTDRRRTRSSTANSTTTKSSENDKDLKIDDPFTVDGKIEENKIESVDLETKSSDTVQLKDKDKSDQETEKQVAKSLETIPETSNENEAKPDNGIQPKEKEGEAQPTTSSTAPSSSSNIQFSKMAPPTTPTTSILKKRRSYNFTSLEVTSSTINNGSQSSNVDNNTPSKRRVSFCESVQIEEIEPNNNKSIYVRTPKPAVSAANKAKLVLSPYFNNVNKSPTTIQREQQLAATIVSSATSTVTTTTADNITSTAITTTTTSSSSSTTTSSTITSTTAPALSALLSSPSIQQPKPLNNIPPSSPSSSLINFFSINKQSFLSQRTSIIQQQMLQQQQNKTELNSPTASSSIIQPTPAVPPSPASTNSALTIPTISHATSTIATTETSSQPISTQSSDIIADSQQANDNENPIYPALKDCQESVNKIVGELTSTMWANGITQLLKSKNIVTIGDLCQLKTSEINNLPFKTPKIDNFMKVIQKYHQQMQSQSQKPQDECQQSEELKKSTQQVTTTDESTSIVTTKTKAQNLPTMGSLEEEMAKLEEDNCLDTSIECESIQINMSQIDNTETIKTSTQVENKLEPNNKVSVDDQDDDIEMIEQLKTIEEAAAATVKQQNSYENILKQLNDSITSQNDKNFQIDILNKQLESVKSNDLLNLSNHVNKMIMRLTEVNGAILKQIQKK